MVRYRLFPRHRTALAIAASALLVSLGVLVATSTVRAQADTEPTCAWPTEVAADQQNIYYPDSSAAYWVQPFVTAPGLRVVLHGRYADSRYTSLTVYGGNGGAFTANGVASVLTDYQIAPDRGSVNPWKRPAPAGGRFTVTLSADAAAGQQNTLPLAPTGTADGTTGYLVYRVYLPHSGDFATVPLPSVTFVQDGTATTVATCPPATASPTASAHPSSTAGTGTDIRFSRPVSTAGVFPNTDSGYLSALITPPGDDQVVVIRGRAPRYSPGRHPLPWPLPGEDLRYWSMCTNLPDSGNRPVVVNQLADGSVDYGCRADQSTHVDSAGRYTYVIGTEAQRAAIENVPGVTFLPFSSTQPVSAHVVLLRNMLAAGGFAAAIQNVPADANPDSAAAVMGAYYPEDAVCPLATLTTRGAEGCVPS
jgi:hypothetical protein